MVPNVLVLSIDFLRQTFLSADLKSGLIMIYRIGMTADELSRTHSVARIKIFNTLTPIASRQVWHVDISVVTAICGNESSK